MGVVVSERSEISDVRCIDELVNSNSNNVFKTRSDPGPRLELDEQLEVGENVVVE